MPDSPNRLQNCRGLLRLGQGKLDEKAERCFQQACWRERSLFFHQGDVASSYSQTFSQFSSSEPSLFSEQRNSFPEFQKMTCGRIVRIRGHLALMKLFEIVVHKYPCR